MLMMVYSARKAKLHYSYVFRPSDPSIREMVRLTVPLMMTNVTWNLSVLVDRNIAAFLGTGIITAMAYGQLLALVLSGLVADSVTTATFPALSNLAAKGERERFATMLFSCVRLLLYVVCPVSVFMSFFSDDIVICVLEHGAMQESSAKVIWECTVCYAVGIVPAAIQSFFLRAFYALHDTKAPSYTVLIYLLCNMGFSIMSSRFFGYAGVVLSTSIAYYIGLFLMAHFFKRNHGIVVTPSLLSESWPCLVISILPALGIFCLLRVFVVIDSRLIRLVLESILFFGLYTAILFVTHKSLFGQMVSMVRRKNSK